MTRRQSLALDQRPSGWRDRAGTRLMQAFERVHLALKRLELRMVTDGIRWIDRPGPSEDTIAMQPEVTR